MSILTTNKQQKLFADLKTIIAINKANSLKLIRQNNINTYWQIGKRIAQENLSENANYKANILQDLSIKLEIEKSVLMRCLYFFETYPIIPEENNLSWSHYRELLTIKDSDLRNTLELTAANENWTKDQLIAAIKNINNSQGKISNLSIAPKLERPTDPTYLYKAKIANVVDGDTLVLLFDLGFQTFREQRVRLAGIDCPERNSVDGQKAKDFVLQKLATVEFVMVKTHKIDIYGRYLGHIFYDSSGNKNKGEIFSQGNYLNMEILNEGLAKIMLF